MNAQTVTTQSRQQHAHGTHASKPDGWTSAVTEEGPGRLFTATREATEPVTATCVACGTRVPIDQSCPQCRATRETKARRDRIRAASA